MEEGVPVNVYIVYGKSNEVINKIKKSFGVNTNTITLSSPGIEVFITSGEFYALFIINSQVGADFITNLPVYIIVDKNKVEDISEELLYSLLTRHISMNIIINEVNYIDKNTVNAILNSLINEFLVSSYTPISIIEEKLTTIYPDGTKKSQSKSEISNSEVTSRLIKILINRSSQSNSDSMKAYF